ncbi:DUF4344 domain-containing metallopeptidase [Streptomyces sp. DT171]|uniref:DUF4344 domain-containing metallopeptidase n=1 Tax=Streptomyces sp. DT171 TaxID=3416524 RepID=UPI003CF436AA
MPCVVALLAGCTASADEGGGSPEAVAPNSSGGGGFVVRHEPPAGADRGDASFLRDRKLLERSSATLNAFIDPGRRVTVVARSCEGEGSGYDPESRRIEICYDDVARERALFRHAGYRPADEEVAAVLVETFFHEAGHAVIDVLDLSFTDRAEEDAADQFAALMLLRQGGDGERSLRFAAKEYELTAAEEEADAESDDADGDDGDRDEHSPARLRAANHLCHLHGSAPGRSRDVVGSTLSRSRAAGCGTEWARVRGAWTERLAPLLRR